MVKFTPIKRFARCGTVLVGLVADTVVTQINICDRGVPLGRVGSTEQSAESSQKASSQKAAQKVAESSRSGCSLQKNPK